MRCCQFKLWTVITLLSLSPLPGQADDEMFPDSRPSPSAANASLKGGVGALGLATAAKDLLNHSPFWKKVLADREAAAQKADLALDDAHARIAPREGLPDLVGLEAELADSREALDRIELESREIRDALQETKNNGVLGPEVEQLKGRLEAADARWQSEALRHRSARSRITALADKLGASQTSELVAKARAARVARTQVNRLKFLIETDFGGPAIINPKAVERARSSTILSELTPAELRQHRLLMGSRILRIAGAAGGAYLLWDAFRQFEKLYSGDRDPGATPAPPGAGLIEHDEVAQLEMQIARSAHRKLTEDEVKRQIVEVSEEILNTSDFASIAQGAHLTEEQYLESPESKTRVDTLRKLAVQLESLQKEAHLRAQLSNARAKIRDFEGGIDAK